MEEIERIRIINAIGHTCLLSLEELATMPIADLQRLYQQMQNQASRTCVFCHSRFNPNELKCPTCKSTYLY